MDRDTGVGEEAGQGPLFPGDSQPACLPLLGSFLDSVSILSKRHISHLRAVRQGQICPLCLVPETLDIPGFLPPKPMFNHPEVYLAGSL